MKPNRSHLGPVQKAALAYVREHPNCSTSDVAIGLGRRVKPVADRLASLVDRRLVGRQQGLSFGEFESTWLAEVDCE